jgi:glycosyltransferase involved in cell wall biosynthesis
VSRETAVGLAGRGWDVEVLTTCAVDHFTWANELPEGAYEEDGLLVRRFSTTHTPSRAARKAELAIQRGEVPPYDEQVTWLNHWFQVPDLFHYLLRYGDQYDRVVFSPYLFWTTAVCLPIVANRAVLIPCLHDETYARLDVFRGVLSSPSLVWFLSEPEHRLAHKLGRVAAHHTVTGAGIDRPPVYDPEGFRARYGIRRPFVLYAGRREAGKGWNWLLDAFGLAVKGGVDIDLVTIGVGPVHTDADLAQRVIDLGFVSQADRDSAFAAASAYIQPSRMESFSRTIMEAWLAGTPVLAVADSEVVVWHCDRSGGGLVFSDEFELAECIRYIRDSPDEAETMAQRGRAYVLSEFSSQVVLDRMESDLEMSP